MTVSEEGIQNFELWKIGREKGARIAGEFFPKGQKCK